MRIHSAVIVLALILFTGCSSRTLNPVPPDATKAEFFECLNEQAFLDVPLNEYEPGKVYRAFIRSLSQGLSSPGVSFLKNKPQNATTTQTPPKLDVFLDCYIGQAESHVYEEEERDKSLLRAHILVTIMAQYGQELLSKSGYAQVPIDAFALHTRIKATETMILAQAPVIRNNLNIAGGDYTRPAFNQAQIIRSISNIALLLNSIETQKAKDEARDLIANVSSLFTPGLSEDSAQKTARLIGEGLLLEKDVRLFGRVFFSQGRRDLFNYTRGNLDVWWWWAHRLDRACQALGRQSDIIGANASCLPTQAEITQAGDATPEAQGIFRKVSQ